MNFNKAFILLFLVTVLTSIANTQEIKKATFNQQGDKIYISYELKGDPDKEYEVDNIVLKNKSKAQFKLEPDELEGDIGEGKYANGSNTIIWTVNKTEQNILATFESGDDFFFQFTVSEIKSGSSWLYYVGGGILAGGGAAAYLILKGKEQTSTPQQNNFPVPPDRP